MLIGILGVGFLRVIKNIGMFSFGFCYPKNPHSFSLASERIERQSNLGKIPIRPKNSCP
jgi:hypothetical protein